MRVGTALTRRSLFLLPVLGGVAAGAGPLQPRRMDRRSLYLSQDSSEEPPEILVWARTVTTLRFESPVDARRTKLEGGEGRFEPLLIGGQSLTLFPLRDLAPQDRFRLTVTLESGQVLPFTLLSNQERVDAQVEVFPDAQSCEALRQQWREIQEEGDRLRMKSRRFEQEELSADHALATLLVTGAVALTRFEGRRKWRLSEPTLEGSAQIFLAAGKAAILITVTNRDPRFSWGVDELRLVHAVTLEPKMFAVRMQCAVLAPGESGRIAVVTSVSPEDAAQRYLLEIFREDGSRHIALDKLVF